jgi:hypothetical protein
VRPHRIVAVFQILDDALDIHQRLLRLLDALLRLTQSAWVGIRCVAQRLVHRLGARQHELCAAVAQFQALQTALREVVLDLRIARHRQHLWYRALIETAGRV